MNDRSARALSRALIAMVVTAPGVAAASSVRATLDPLPGNVRCAAIHLQNGQTAFCGTRSVPDDNPFQFDRAVGSVQVTDLVHREQFAFSSPFVG
ncbi:hypothetical protein [Nonomuraea sp. NPDC005692]|uniref:hypothetical protein n=1 Tax=Nonomuraea sp. NPDC005692 TaxID=3157168 RepID=UPI0033EE39F0